MALVDEVATRAERERVEWEALLRRRDLAPRVRGRLEMVKAAALGQAVAASPGRGRDHDPEGKVSRPAHARGARAIVESAPPPGQIHQRFSILYVKR